MSSKTYTYGNTVWKDLLTGYNGATLSYDAIGNLTGDGTWSYNWQHGRQLAGMSKTGTAVSFGYDADGLRVSKTVNGATTKYYYTGSQLDWYGFILVEWGEKGTVGYSVRLLPKWIRKR